MTVVRELLVSLGFVANTKGIDEVEGRIDKIPGRITPAVNQIRNMFIQAFAGISAGIAFKEFIVAGDEMLAIRAKLGSGLNESAGRTTEFLERIYELSKQTGTALDSGATAFARFAGAARQSGRSYEEAFALVETLQKSFILNGTTGSEAASVTLQVGQALSKGVFNDDEFKSFMENAGPLAEEFAKALGKTVPELRAMSTAGKLTTDIVFPALIKAGARFREQFDKMPLSATSAFAILKVVTKRTAADINLMISASLLLGKGINYIAQQIEYLRTKLPIFADFISNQVGIRNILEMVGITLAVVYGPALLRTFALATAAALRFAFTVGLPAIGFALVGLAIQDVLTYMRGGQSVIGEFIKSMHPDQVKVFADAWKMVGDNVKYVKDTFLELKAAWDSFSFNDFVYSFKTLMARNGMTFRNDLPMSYPGGEPPPDDGVPRVPGSASPQGSAGTAGGGWLSDFFRSFGKGAGARPGASTAPIPLPSTLYIPQAPSQTIQPTINQEFNITNPGTDGNSLANSVGTAARNGAETAMRFGNTLARDLLMGSPMTESGAR